VIDLEEFASFFATVQSSNTDEWMLDAGQLLNAVAKEGQQTITMAGEPGNYRFILRGRGTALDGGDT
jgi:hypothetical protein